MRTVSLRLTDLIKTVIPIGFVGENLHTKVFVDCKIAFDEYPTATVAMTVKPPKGDAYPAVVSRNGDIVTWDVSDSDLLYEGNGEIQLAFVVDEVIAKSYIGRTRIQRSIIPTGEIPTPIEDWIIKADEILDSIPGQIDSALEEAKESGEFDGEDGFSPEVSVEEITGGHQVSITDAEGTNTFDVMDGAPGDPGAPGAPGPGVSPGGTTGQVLKKRSNADYDTEWAEEAGGVRIDDSAGIGDTGVTWSANKSATELKKKYVKPSGGIPASDIANGVIPDVRGKADKVSNATSGDFAGLDSNGNLTDSGSKASDFISSSLKGSNNGVAELDSSGRVPSSQLPSYVDDVQVNGTSVVSNGVANIPVASYLSAGVVKTNTDFGTNMRDAPNDDTIMVVKADSSNIKSASQKWKPIVPYHQHESTFFGLAKAAGADMASLTSTTVGQYPDAQKIAIQKMLGIYEPPYVLLNDITLQTESRIELTTDSDGTPYNLRSVYIEIYYPENITSASDGYARYKFNDLEGGFLVAETGKYTNYQYAAYKHIHLIRYSNLTTVMFSTRSAIGSSVSWQTKRYSGSGGGATIDLGNIVKINMYDSDVEPASTNIKVWGQWAY